MTKVLPATCVGGVVTADNVPVPETTILSEGVASSSGVLVLDGDRKTYIPKTSPDLKSTLTQLESALTETASALNQVVTALGTVSAATVPPTTGGIATAVAAITASAVQINLAKSSLTTLKGAMK